MTHELALKLAKTETPEQMADRIVELYETIDDLRAENGRLREDRDVYADTTMRWWYQARQNNLAAWRANKRLAAMMRERDDLQIQLDKTREALDTVAQMASAYVSVTGNTRAEERLEKTLAAIEEEQMKDGGPAYPSRLWTPWSGGDRPVPADTLVEIITLGCPGNSILGLAWEFDWTRDLRREAHIIKYRVVEEAATDDR